VTGELPNREQALKILEDHNCPPQVINHCKAVSKFAIEIANKIYTRGNKINLNLVEIGALLHDIGRSKTHNVEHAIVGAQIGQTIGLPLQVVNIIKRHVGAGISEEEAVMLGWPRDNYMPTTLEEKVVTYADKCVDHDSVIPIEGEIKKLQANGFLEAAERVRKLHSEISYLLGEIP